MLDSLRSISPHTAAKALAAAEGFPADFVVLTAEAGRETGSDPAVLINMKLLPPRHSFSVIPPFTEEVSVDPG